MRVLDCSDVVIAGGGIAGLTAAAALSKIGYRIMLVEPGMTMERRLAGEMIHPMGVMALKQIGFWQALERLNPTRICGFAISVGKLNGAPSASPKAAHTLSYTEAHGLQEQGIALRHGILRDTLTETVMNLPNVTVLAGWRLQGLDLDHPDYAVARVGNSQQSRTIRCSLVIAADGPSSATRRMAGITVERKCLSNMVGYIVRDAELPLLNYAHLFLGGSGPIFACPIGNHSVRLLFDGPLKATNPELVNHCHLHLALLPLPFRLAAKKTIDTEQPQIAVNQSVTPGTVAHGRVALVGDAGGCCHPVTASGLTNCARDALRLRDALLEAPDNIPAAVANYRKRRVQTQRTRSALAGAVYDVSCAQAPELSILQAGLFKYWEHRSARTASIELLSTLEERMIVFSKEWSRILLFGASVHAYESVCERQFSFSKQSQVAVGFSRLLLRHAKSVVGVRAA